MSNGAINWALTWTRPHKPSERTGDEPSSAEKFVLVVLANYYNESCKRAWPSLNRIAADTNQSTRHINRHITRLEEIGLIEKEPWINSRRNEKAASAYLLPLYDGALRSPELPVLWDPAVPREKATQQLHDRLKPANVTPLEGRKSA